MLERHDACMFLPVSAEFDVYDYLTAFRDAAEAHGFRAVLLAELDAGPLIAWERPGNGPRVYISAGIHGDEPAGPLALLDLLREDFFASPIQWSICPMLNPSGFVRCSRENEDGVDLNRDYWQRSTLEVVAHARWLNERSTPDLFISLHEDWESTGFYFYEINLGEEDLGRSQLILDAVSPWFSPETGPEIDGHTPRGPGWIYHAAEPDLPEGWPVAIYLAKMGCPISFTFETPSQAPLAERVAAHVAAVKAACEGLPDQIGESGF